MRVLTPEEFDRLRNVPAEHRAMVLLAAETGMRWGELVALRPHHLNPATATLTVQDVYVEVSKKHSPTGNRMNRAVRDQVLDHFEPDDPRLRRGAGPRNARITRWRRAVGTERDDGPE